MPRKKSSDRLPASVYLEYFRIVARALRAAGFETLPTGAVMTGVEVDVMDQWCERGETAEAFGQWIIVKRHEERVRELALSDENIGQETIAPCEVAA